MSVMLIRQLNEHGIDRMLDFLEELTEGLRPDAHAVQQLLSDRTTSEALPIGVYVDQHQVFSRRFDIAAYLHDRIPRVGLADPTRNKGLWAWLALLWFNQLCPPSRDGTRKPGEAYRYIPELDNFQTYYRHRILGPYLIYAAHSQDPRRALCMLCQHPRIHPDTAEQLASRQDLIQSSAVVAVATALYYDPNTETLRRGSTTYRGDRAAPGTLRRLVEVSWQLDRTFDHLSMTETEYMKLLPAEFRRFLPAS